ncbi:MAG TPA: helix-turn-helix transcriptional regulator [Acidimicrobiales bacterium]|nr:helix-turn-helix transcriptional regulator [Acidimicrobiales bacterium]
MAVVDLGAGVGSSLREWRERQRLSQLALALAAGISARHLSFIETGRSKPGRDVLLRLTECLEVPLRERNELLLVSGYAPAFSELPLQDPMLAPVREALDVIISGHEPYPAVVVDRYWNLVAASTLMVLLAPLVDASLLEPPVNAMRVGLHPEGLARWTVNLAEVRSYFIGRLERQVALTRDPKLKELLQEVTAYPAPEVAHDFTQASAAAGILTPEMRFRLPDGGELAFFATVLTFGTALDVTASELSIELGFPADALTAETLNRVVGNLGTQGRPGQVWRQQPPANIPTW